MYVPRHEQTCLLGYRPSPNKPHDVDHDHYDIHVYICIMWSNAISVRTSAMIETTLNKSFKISWWSVLVANAESCEYVVHSSFVNFCSKISLVPKIYV